MEEINLDGRILQFKVESGCGEDNYWEETTFYEGLETYRPWWSYLIGKKVCRTRPKMLFKLYFSPYDPHYSKEDLHTHIRLQLSKIDGIQQRKEEIKNKQFI